MLKIMLMFSNKYTLILVHTNLQTHSNLVVISITYIHKGGNDKRMACFKTYLKNYININTILHISTTFKQFFYTFIYVNIHTPLNTQMPSNYN